MHPSTNTSRRAFLRTGASTVAALPVATGTSLAAAIVPAAAPDATLATLSLEDLHTLFDALCAARDGWQAVYNQPRCAEPVADLLDAEMERLERRTCEVFEVAKRREPRSNRERDHKATIIVKWIKETGGFELLPEAMATMAGAVA